jgi:hypothetical protein
MEKKTKKILGGGLLVWLACLGFSKYQDHLDNLEYEALNSHSQNAPLVERIQPIEKPVIERAISYKLEDLCDTEIREREINIDVYISPDEKLWDYHDYRDDIFSYLSEYFLEAKVKCDFNFLESPFNPSLERQPNHLYIEILPGKREFIDRILELQPVENEKERNNLIFGLSMMRGWSISKRGAVLLDGGWEEFRGYMTRDEIEPQFEDYSSEANATIGEHLFRMNAGLLFHEAGHNFGLCHTEDFEPHLVETHQGKVPNFMSYYPINLKDSEIGYNITDLQKKLLHSYISGGMTYRALRDSDNDLGTFARNIASSNNLGTREAIVITEGVNDDQSSP